MISNGSFPCNNQWSGNEIEFYQNDLLILTFPSGFGDVKKCFALRDIDKKNDIFKFKIAGNDNVSFNSSKVEIVVQLVGEIPFSPPKMTKRFSPPKSLKNRKSPLSSKYHFLDLILQPNRNLHSFRFLMVNWFRSIFGKMFHY